MDAQWLELARLGLLGTDRAAPDGILAQELADLGLDMDTDLNEFLLNGAALLRLPSRMHAGFQAYEGALPEPVMTHPNEKNCSHRTALHLADILSGKYDLALEEFLVNLVEQNLFLPAEQLPGLFTRSLVNPEIWPFVRQAAGMKGQWLLTQNPDWSALAQHPDPEQWPAAGLPERKAILKFLSVENPDKAADLVRSAWRQASPGERVAYLSAFAENPSRCDESFLVDALGDSRKEVRLAAADLLASIPGSALSKQLFLWASGCLSLTNDRLILNLPSEIPPDSEQFGILPATVRKGEGAKSTWFGQLLARIPPKKWEEYFQKDAGQLLAVVKNTRNNGPMIENLSQAAIRFEDGDWATAFTGVDHEGLWAGNSGKKLARLLPSSVFNRLALQTLARTPMLEEKGPLTMILYLGQHKWEKNLSIGLIRQFQSYLFSSRTYSWDSWHYKRLLEVAGYKADPSLLDDFRRGWPFNAPVWPKWAPEVEKMLQTMTFRLKMLEELKR